MPGIPLGTLANVQHAHAFRLPGRELAVLDHLRVPAEAIRRHVASDVHRVLGSAIGRRVGEFQVLQVIHGHAGLQRYCQGVDGAVDSVDPDHLGAEQEAVLRPVEQFDRLLRGAGVVGHMVHAVRD